MLFSFVFTQFAILLPDKAHSSITLEIYQASFSDMLYCQSGHMALHSHDFILYIETIDI